MELSRRMAIGGATAALAGPAFAALPLTPSQVLGPMYPRARPADQDADLTRLGPSGPLARGQVIEVSGRVLDIDGRPVPGARLDIWQANAAGRYDHPNDTRTDAPLDPNFQGSTVLVADDQGRWRLRTIKPGAYPAGAMMRTPHIHFTVSGRVDRLVTQMYFPGEPLNGADAVLSRAGRSDALVARPLGPLAAQPRVLAFGWDVVLRG